MRFVLMAAMLAAVGWSASGCAPVTGDVPVDELSVFYQVTASGSETRATAQFDRYGPISEGVEGTIENLDLGGGDLVEVTLGDSTVALALDEQLSSGFDLQPIAHRFSIYSALLPAGDSGDEIVFAMTRADGVVLQSTITIPPPPAFTPPGEEFSRADGLVITPDGDLDGDILLASVQGDCVPSYSSESDETGVRMSFDGAGDAVCDVSLLVSRLRTANGNPQFADSAVDAYRASDPLTLRCTP